jgi:hypothetical protein
MDYRRLEINELERLERYIESHIDEMRPFFKALKPIRDERLWELDYKSWDDYCKQRWGFTCGAEAVDCAIDVCTGRDTHEINHG